MVDVLSYSFSVVVLKYERIATRSSGVTTLHNVFRVTYSCTLFVATSSRCVHMCRDGKEPKIFGSRSVRCFTGFGLVWFGFLPIFLLSGSVLFLAKPVFWFGSFLLRLASFPSLFMWLVNFCICIRRFLS